MRVLHIGSVRIQCGASGVEHCIRKLVTAQADVGLEVGLLSSLPIPEEGLLGDIPDVCLLGGSGGCHMNPWFLSKKFANRIFDKFGKPDIVIFHSTYVPFQIALARRFRQLSCPYVITPHGGMTRLAQNAKRAKKSIANFLCFNSYVKHAAAIHALTVSEAVEIESLFKVKKIITVPNGVEDYLLKAQGKLAPADLDNFANGVDLMLGFVGRLNVPHKGLDLLLEAMAILKSRPGGPKCKLFMVGPFSSKRDRNYVLSSIRSLGLRDSVKLLGSKFGQEKWGYFLACDVFVHTSRYEGMPMAVLEAMALARPCLVTPGTNVADVVQEAGGWQCQLSPESIAEAIKSIYEKRESLEELGRRSQQLMRRRFTWRKVAEQLSVEYAKIIEQNKS